MLRPEFLAEELRFILEHSPASPGLPLRLDLVANPAAGGFTRARYAARRTAELASLRVLASALPRRKDEASLNLHLTEAAGHASDLVRGIIARARDDGYPPALRVLATAGGDGTSLEAVSALMELPPDERALWLILRLPLGTGNDGSEGRDLGSCLGRFLGPCAAGPRTALRITPNPVGGKPFQWSFNIASLGADAFIAHMTNRLKSIFPGDSYMVMVDLAAITYDFLWPAKPMRIGSSGPAGQGSLESGCLLLAMGATGNRQYGSNKKILPGDENVCFVPSMSMFRKLAIKGPLSSGGHAAFPEVALFSADRLVIEYPAPLLFQADGEVTRFEAVDFPLVMEAQPGAYLVLEGAKGPE